MQPMRIDEVTAPPAKPAAARAAGEDTLIDHLMFNARAHGGEIAMREKARGIWKETTWAEYAEEIVRFAAALDGLGVKAGNAMIILGDNRVHLYGGMVAMAMLRGFPMPTYTGATLEELRHFTGEAPVAVALAEDQEQVDKVLELRAAGSDITYIVYDDPRGLQHYRADGLLSWDEMQDKGAARLKADPGMREMEIVLTGNLMPIERLHGFGFTNYLEATPDAVRARALELAVAIRSAAPLSVQAAKASVRATMDAGCQGGLDAGKRLHEKVYASRDAVEGPRAFAEKRAPVWQGR